MQARQALQVREHLSGVERKRHWRGAVVTAQADSESQVGDAA